MLHPHADLILTVEREIDTHRPSATGIEWHVIAHTGVLPRRNLHGEGLLGRTLGRIADRKARDPVRRQHVALHQARR